MSVRRIAALLSVPLALALACGGLFFCRTGSFLVSSLDNLIGTSGQMIPPAIRQRSSALVPVIVSAHEAGRVRTVAEALAEALHAVEVDGLTAAASCTNVRFRVADDEFGRLLDFCRGHGSGLVAPTAVEKLKTPEGRAMLARAAARTYCCSPVPPLFPPATDPFCLLDGFVRSLPMGFSGWMPKDGVLMAERNGVAHVLILLELKDEVSRTLDKLIQFKCVLDAAIASVKKTPDVSVAACGVPLHTAVSAGSCKREIGALTVFSLVFIALLAVVAFRGVRWIPLLALSLTTSVLAGFCVLLAAFDVIHLIALVIGTTVLGLVIDYSFHWLMQAEAERPHVVRNLLVSFVTTEISLVPLMLSSIPVLRQSSVFLGVGLAAALGYVIVCYPRTARVVCAGREDVCRGWTRALSLGVALLGLAGLFRAQVGTDMTALYRPPDELQVPERVFAEISGTTEGDRGFVVTEGEDLETLLTREFSLGLPPDVPRLSRFLPPLSVRREIAANVARLYAEQGAKQAKLLGIETPALPPAPTAWMLDDVPRELVKPFLVSRCEDGRPVLSLVVTPAPKPVGVLPDGSVFCQPKELVGRVLSAWTSETAVRLALALALMFVALAVFVRRRAFAVFAPSLFALLVVGGLVGLAGETVNLFHLLAGFLLAGMGVDYTVFLHSGKSQKPALCSLLTSVAGFGALGFVSFPVVQSFGVVLGIGLPIAFVAAHATSPRADTTERAATPLGLELLYFVYRLFGLRVLHAASACVGVCAWLFSRGVRRASPSVRKVVNFTRSLADKMVVMAGGRSLPTVEPDASADARAFFDDVCAGRGVFVLSSHCGTIEVLVAIGECKATFHAWMDFDRTSVYNRFYLRHAHRPRVVLHPISEIGVETAFLAGDALERGDSLVMAGDRGIGAFRFAHALGAPVYFVACVWHGRGYKAIIRRLPSETRDMARAYSAALAEVSAAYPEQCFNWE